MKQTQQSPALNIGHDHVDYSEMYRTQEMKQLNKRLRKTRNVLLISAAALIAGGCVFWIMPESSFTTTNFLLYLGLGAIIAFLSVFSNKQPYFSILTALIFCLCFWGAEIFFELIGELVVIGAIQKLFVVSLLVSSFHASREAELIRKELHFS